MPFIVPGVARFTMHGTIGTKNIANVLDMFIDTTDSIVSRPDAIEAQAGILINEWCDHVLPMVSTVYSFNEVSWVDLDEANGTTGSRSQTSQEQLPQNGVASGDAVASNVAVLVRKATQSRRGFRSGRIYFVGINESSVAGNSLTTSAHAVWETNMASFLGNINQAETGLPDAYSSRLVVTHILTRDSEGNPATGDSTDVTELATQELLATQRRRLRR